MKQLAFAVLTCIIQHRRGRYFIVEHPDGARSWSTNILNMLLELPRVQRVQFDFCMAGMLARKKSHSVSHQQRGNCHVDREAEVRRYTLTCFIDPRTAETMSRVPRVVLSHGVRGIRSPGCIG